MRCLLINPTLDGETLTQHLGVTSIASFINHLGNHRCDILDFGFRRKNWKDYLRVKLDQKYDVVGITIATPNLISAKHIVEAIRENSSREPMRIITGGPHCSIMPEQVFQELDINALVIGEGEHALQEYLDALSSNRNLNTIQGLWYKDGSQVVKNSVRSANPHLESLPRLNWDLWEDIDKQLKIFGLLSFYGVRGCPHKCSYCSSETLCKQIPGNFRYIDPEVYVEQIKETWYQFRNRGMEVAWLWDQVFTYNQEWFEGFIRNYQKAGLHSQLPFSIYARADELNQKTAQILSKNGCINVRIGFESGNDYIRKEIYNKHISKEQIFQAVDICHKNGIGITGYFILGGPGDNYETMNDTYELVKKIKIDVPTFYVYKPLPGTRAVKLLEEMGGTVKDLWKHRVVDIRFGGMVSTPYLKPEQVERYQYRCILRFIPFLILKQVKFWNLNYLPLLLKYIRETREYKLPLIDVYRNFTYKMQVNTQIKRMRWRNARHFSD